MDLHARQYARLNVTTIQEEGGSKRPLNRSFSVDPRTITLERLQHLLARALDIRQEFSLQFERSCVGGSAALACDWDLEGALAEEPSLDLHLVLHPREPELEEWDIICDADVPVAGHEALAYPPPKRKESFLEQLLHLSWPGSPLSVSQLEQLRECPAPLRWAVWRAGGAEPAARPELWLHLLDVFPSGAGEPERSRFLDAKCEEYFALKHAWQKLQQAGTVPPALRDVTSLVRKDVRRTDRAQGLDERAMADLLTTFALNHPSLGYCQGMGDLLSPLLSVQRSEARAYVAFCGLMRRAAPDFRRDGRAMALKFRHLRRALRAHDPRLYERLGAAGALDLLFCYRWLLLGCKREFPYRDMLRLLELQWAALPPLLSEEGAQLFERRFPPPGVCEAIRDRLLRPRGPPLPFREDHFGTPANSRTRATAESEEDEDDDARSIVHYRRCSSWAGRSSARESGHQQPSTVHDFQLDRWMNRGRRRHASSDSNYGSTEENSASCSSSEDDLSRNDSLDSFTSADTFFSERGRASPLLPPPARLCGGRPFLLFLCLAMILEHRDAVLEGALDASEIGIYFDRLVRRHRLADVLPRARGLFEQYLVSGWTEDD